MDLLLEGNSLRSFSVWIVCVSLLFVFHLPSAGADELDEPDTGKDYPYFPSLLRWNKSRADFTSPSTCAMCHQDKFREWKGSMHEMAFVDPLYRGELSKAHKEADRGVTRQCEGCHTPAAFVKGEIKDASIEGISSLAMAGVSCDVCHSVSGHSHWETPAHQPGNGSLVLSPGKDTKDGGKELTKFGPLPVRGEGRAGFHVSIESPLHLRSKLCGGCHQIFHSRTHTPLESTYSEWKNGPYSARDIHCQDCHMVDTDTFQRSADDFVRPSTEEYRHYFNGVNFLMYSLSELAARKKGDNALADEANHKYEMAVARLKLAADLTIEPIQVDGMISEIKVTVKNLRAGHNLPTSLSTIRQLWLELTMEDAQGTVIYSTGTVTGMDPVPENARMFNSQGQDSTFRDTIDPWKITSFRRHTTIPPRGERTVYYGVPLKRISGGPTTVTVTLRYRQAAQEVVETFLSLAPGFDTEKMYGLSNIPLVPIINLAEKRLILK